MCCHYGGLSVHLLYSENLSEKCWVSLSIFAMESVWSKQSFDRLSISDWHLGAIRSTQPTVLSVFSKEDILLMADG